MEKIVIVTNIPSPYRIDLFYYMQTYLKEYEIHIIYASQNVENRQWLIKEEKMLNSYILKSKIIKVKDDMDTRHIQLPSNLMGILNELNPDVIIAWEYNPSALQSLIWAKLHGKKFIHLTDGTLNSEKNISKIQRFTRKIITRNADSCIASSTKAKEKLLTWGVKEEAIFISLLTVDITQYIKMKKIFGKNKLLYVGSMIKRKGLDLLIDALPYIDTEYELRIVGNGSKEEIDALSKQAKKLGVAEHISWCGFKTGNDLAREYNEATLFVLPTREDCFGLVLLEALCTSTPIVTSKYADGSYDIIKEGVNGFIVDPYNSKEMAEAINCLLQNQNMQEKFSDACQEQIADFTFEEVSKGYIKAIEYACEKK